VPRGFPIGAARLELHQGDITKVEVDAIVNAANSSLLGGGGVDGAIHRAAGPELLRACREVKKTLPDGRLATGDAVLTPGFQLLAKAVIHCVGPVYSEHREGAWPLLASCYRKALALCRQNDCDSVAFPSISTGAYACPIGRAAEVALSAIRDDLLANVAPQRVLFVLFDRETYGAYEAAGERLLMVERG
jgi:O-acetyl-ADP-ribose deacetylase (regulator of RNase III)